MPSAMKGERKAERKTSKANCEISGIDTYKSSSREPEERVEKKMQNMEHTMASVNHQMSNMSSMIDAKFEEVASRDRIQRKEY